MSSLRRLSYGHLLFGFSLIFLNLFISLVQSGCATHSDQVLSKDPELLWELATEAFENGDWSAAKDRFEKFSRFFPQTNRAVIAKLKVADSLFHDRKYLEAEVHYEHFIELYPRHPDTPRALLQLALSQKNQVPGLLARDISKAYDALKTLDTFFKASDDINPFLKLLAEDHYRETESMIMQKELEIGNWYYKLGHHRSAYHRYQYVLDNYIHLKPSQQSSLFTATRHMLTSAIRLKNLAFLRRATEYLDQFRDHRDYESVARMARQVNTDKWFR